MTDAFQVRVRKCGSCGGDHGLVQFIATEPDDRGQLPVLKNGDVLWGEAKCPVTGRRIGFGLPAWPTKVAS